MAPNTVPEDDRRTFLFCHKTFPGQFGSVAKFLGMRGHKVHFLTQDVRFSDKNKAPKIPWGQVLFVPPPKTSAEGVHRFLKGTHDSVVTAEAYLKAARGLKAKGVEVDLTCAHSGWGTGSFMSAVWPHAAAVQYLEWWYSFPARDVPEDKVAGDPHLRASYALVRNLPFMLDAQVSDCVLVPTHFQAAEQPRMIKDKITVIHDGVDTGFFSPGNPEEWKPASLGIPQGAPILTYATRGMEPARGFPDFMAALSRVQTENKDVHCVIAGTDTTHYSSKPGPEETWKDRALAEHNFDLERLHFVGRLPFTQYRDLLRASSVHTTLTQPFVLSWSVIQSMATGCALVVSDNSVIREALPSSDMAVHVDHRDTNQLAGAILALLGDAEKRQRLGMAARKHACAQYDERPILHRKERLFQGLIARRRLDAII